MARPLESLPFQFEKKEYWEFYCPICKAQRRSFYWPSPRPRHYFQLSVFILFLIGCLWKFIGVKGIFLGFPVWATFEFFYRARARQSLICPHCGFDPYLYKFDAKLARKRVEQFFDAKKKAREAQSKEVTSNSNPTKK